jgi:hypothetical protein
MGKENWGVEVTAAGKTLLGWQEEKYGVLRGRAAELSYFPGKRKENSPKFPARS